MDQKKSQSLNDINNNTEYENALFAMIEALYLEFGQVNQRINEIHKSFFPDEKQSITKDLKDINEAVPEQNMIAKEFANLREQINKLSNLQESLEAKQEELDSLQEKQEHLKSLLEFRDYENNKLRHELKFKDEDNKKLIKWIEKLNVSISKLLQSKRWKTGHFIGELQRKLLIRPKRIMEEDKINEIFYDYRSWKKQ